MLEPKTVQRSESHFLKLFSLIVKTLYIMRGLLQGKSFILRFWEEKAWLSKHLDNISPKEIQKVPLLAKSKC